MFNLRTRQVRDLHVSIPLHKPRRGLVPTQEGSTSWVTFSAIPSTARGCAIRRIWFILVSLRKYLRNRASSRDLRAHLDLEPLRKIHAQTRRLHAVLTHRVAFANGHRTVF